MDETCELVSRAGTFENIKRWYFWTPLQLSIMGQAEHLPRVLLFGGNGTGKTTVLESFIMKIAEKEDSEIIYIIITKYPNLLLKLQMEVRFEHLKILNPNQRGNFGGSKR